MNQYTEQLFNLVADHGPLTLEQGLVVLGHHFHPALRELEEAKLVELSPAGYVLTHTGDLVGHSPDALDQRTIEALARVALHPVTMRLWESYVLDSYVDKDGDEQDAANLIAKTIVGENWHPSTGRSVPYLFEQFLATQENYDSAAKYLHDLDKIVRRPSGVLLDAPTTLPLEFSAYLRNMVAFLWGLEPVQTN